MRPKDISPKVRDFGQQGATTPTEKRAYIGNFERKLLKEVRRELRLCLKHFNEIPLLALVCN